MTKKHVLKFIALLLFFFSSVVCAADLSAHVDRDHVGLNETFNLIFSINSDNNATLDISALNQDFNVLGSAQTNQMNMTDGKTEAKTQWVIQLQPKQVGTFTIPALALGDQKTQPITITVAQNGTLNNTAKKSGNITLEGTVSSENPYVQSQVIYTLRLVIPDDMASNVQSATLTPPQATNVVVKQLGDFARYTTMQGGQRYQVAEGKYALFPQNSGVIKITPAQFKGEELVPLNVRSDDNFYSLDSQFFGTGLRPLTASAIPVTLTVKPQPSNINSTDWLPAQNITLHESWSADPNNLRVGDPITRTVKISATGLTGAQLPNLNLGNIPNVNIYPDLPTTNTSNTSDSTIGERIMKIAYVATEPGKINIPPVSLSWWNTSTEKVDIATLPEHVMNILPAIGQTNHVNNTPPIAAPAPVEKQSPVVQPKIIYTYWPWIVAGLFALAWLITMFFWLKQKRLSIFDEIEKSHEVIPIKASTSTIKQACKANNILEVKTSLIGWANSKWPHARIRSLGQIADTINSRDLKHAIKRLDYVLYADGKISWNGKEFWKIFSAFLKQKPAKVKKSNDALPSLYPSRDG